MGRLHEEVPRSVHVRLIGATVPSAEPAERLWRPRSGRYRAMQLTVGASPTCAALSTATALHVFNGEMGLPSPGLETMLKGRQKQCLVI